MKSKVITGVMFTFLFIGMLTLAFDIQPVKASGIIYIRPDGSIDPPTANITTVDNVTYTFTGNINESIVVERDNIVVDGAGFTLQGTTVYLSEGIYLSYRSNVTIENTNIRGFYYGIHLKSSLNNVVSGNILANNSRGICIDISSNNIVSGNTITNNDVYGILLRVSDYNTVSGNTITNNDYGISILASSNNTVSGNIVQNSTSYGIEFYQSTNNHIVGNSIFNNGVGIEMHDYGSHFTNSINIISGNNVTHNRVGIRLYAYSDNIIYRNNFANNIQNQAVAFSTNVWDYGSSLGGNFWSDYTGVDANGDGIGDTPYIIDHNNKDRYPLINICGAWKPTFISISTSQPSTLLGFEVKITGTLFDTYGNPLENKTVVLYYTFSGANTWVPITSNITDHLGHYSVEWIPLATGCFTIKAEWAGNATHFTASNSITLSTIPHKNRYVFSVESNSTISALAINSASRELSFNASGPSGTRGYVKITIAKTLVGNIADVKVYLDGNQLNYTVTSLDDSWLLHFTYLHSTHNVTVSLGDISAPFIEIPLGKVLIYGISITAIVILIALYVLKKKKIKEPVKCM